MVDKFPTLIKDVCARTKSLKLCLTLCDTMDCGPPGPLSMGFSRQEYCSGLPCPSPGNLPNPEIKPAPLVTLALADGFFTTSTTWETQTIPQFKKKELSLVINTHIHTGTRLYL